MDTQIIEFIDILKDNSFIAKQYCPEDLDESFNPEEWDLKDEYVVNENMYAYDVLMQELESGSISKDLLTLYEIHGYQKPSDLEGFLISHFEKFKTAFVSNDYSNQINVKKEIVNQVRTIKNQLDNLLDNSKLIENYLFESIIKVKIEICSETIRFINFAQAIIINQPAETPTQQSNTPKQVRIRRPLEKLTDLTQNQIIILFHYLRENGFVGKEMPKNLYAKQISELTGFAAEKIRQDLSHIGKQSNSLESGQFLEADYSVVRRSLDKVIASIRKDSEERFPS